MEVEKEWLQGRLLGGGIGVERGLAPVTSFVCIDLCVYIYIERERDIVYIHTMHSMYTYIIYVYTIYVYIIYVICH